MTQNIIDLKGKYTNPRMYIQTVDEVTIGQVSNMANELAMQDTTIRIMPDAHYGKGSTIGTTIHYEKGIKRIVPDIVGVDIGCSIRATKLNLTHLSQDDLKKLDQVIKEYVPAGFNVNSRPTNRINQAKIDTILENITLDVVRTPNEYNRLKLSVGTLGGGNHYISVEKLDEDYYLMTHTGSRRLGALVASTHQKIADKSFEAADLTGFINELKEQSRHKDIENLIKQFKQTNRLNMPNLRYLKDSALDNYLNDMHYTQEYAWLNHEAITNEILTRMNWEAADSIHSMHNYIDIDKNILRKGATDASLGTRLIVPLNMRDGSLIAIGKGNKDWNHSAPHGAGRVLSRTKAKDQLNLADYQSEMIGIYSTSVVQSTLDEAPNAYKPAKEIIENTGDTMDIIAHVKPVYNFKSH